MWQEDLDMVEQNTLRLEISALEAVNFALQQNRIPVIRSLQIINDGDAPLENVVLTIAANPAICLHFEKHFDLIPAKSVFRAGNIDLTLDPEYLCALTEKVSGNLYVCLSQGDTALCAETLPITALAYDEWHGSASFPEMLAAFVTPNHPEIARITARAAQLLEKWTGDPSLDGYQTQDANRVLSQAAAIYGAIQEMNLVYSVPPASFEAAGQRVRLCDAIIQQKMGTCLDLTLLYAACLEAIGLHPLLIEKPGHIFAGLWLEDLSFPEAVQDDAALVTKRLASGISQIAVVECTAMTSGKKMHFDAACAAGEQQLLDQKVENIIDVHRARISGIAPIPLRVKTESGWAVQRPALQEQELTDAPQSVLLSVDTDDAAPEAFSKKVQWERKLLDLGLRNNLINMRLNKSTVPILTSSLDALENALSDGRDFTILPRPANFQAPESLALETIHDLQGNGDLIDSEFKNKRLRSLYTETELTKTLKNLYRSAKTALEENGANTLYLALGLLRWYETPRSTKPRFAPIVLLPVELVRRSIRQGYVLRLRDDEPQMNITVLEKLKQDFHITVSGLDPLPMDEQGVDTRKVFTILRKAVMNQPRWDVLESATLGIFSFSQFVMWNDIRNRSDDLAKNKIVRSLMDGKLCWQAQDMTIGERVSEENVFLPLSADASQLFAIEAATKGESFVLHGPPGTGKSQTITALIANALAQGKTVLFVAEKMAALEVVQRRLSKIGIGPFCLELHSNKSKKRDVLEQLRLATEVTKNTTAESYAAKAESIAALRRELDQYAAGLHKKLPCGKTLFDLVNGYDENSAAPDTAPFSPAFVKDLTAQALDTQHAVVERLIAAAKAVGHPSDHPLQNICCTAYSQQIRYTLPEAIGAYRTRLAALKDAVTAFCLAIGEKPQWDHGSLDRLAGIARELQLWLDLPKAWAEAENNKAYLLDVQKMAKHFHNAAGMKQKLTAVWKEEFLSQDGKALAAQWDTAAEKWVLARMMGQSGLVRRLNALAKASIEKDSLRGQISDLIAYQEEKAAADALFARFGSGLGALYSGEETNWQQVMDSSAAAQLSWEKLKSAYDTDIRQLYASGSIEKAPVNTLLHAWEQYSAAKAALYDLLALSDDTEAADYPAQQLALCDSIEANADALKDWIAWNAIAEEAANLGLGNVVDAYRSGMTHEQLLPAYRKGIYKALSMAAIDADPALSRFSGAVFNEKIQQLQRLDGELTSLTQQEIYCRLAAKVPNFAKEAANSSELGILQRAIRSGGRGISIRKLFEQIPNLLPRLCPCMLMSPISAAQYLDPKREGFDLVVFDEASQLPTCKAVGVLARGKDAVIVGDPKQMPPTAFFATNTVDEDNLEAEDLESILDDCLALNIPQTHLLWHYRSRHESLIAFSNSQFYENKLYTFPSVNDLESKVHLVHVDGVFERGKQRQNRAEADAIVAELKRRCHDEGLKSQSVGVVTFNIQQQHLIDDLLAEACREDPALEAWAFQSEEPVFIKNLENVQGDERDVILFSIGYGPDEDGKVYMNFGPLNRDGGWRRLNVAITRARQEMTVFSTLRPEQIDLNRTTAQGVAALKAFLEYAERQKLPMDETTVQSCQPETQGIARTICDFLGEKGYETTLSVGHSAYRIDIGVIDPKDPGSYLLGILLDGSSYGSTKTTRDREIAQIGVLKGLGWRITRIWTMDWWDNRQKELDRILALLQQPAGQPEAEKAAPLPPAAPEIPVPAAEVPQKLAGNVTAPAPQLPVYSPARLSETKLSAEDFLQGKYAPGICKKITAVMEAEAPISESLLTRRILQSYDIARAGSRIQSYLGSIFASMDMRPTAQGEETFFWKGDQDPDSYLSFRTGTTEENRREARDIPVQEAAAAVCHVLAEQISLPQEDLIRESAKALGYARVGTALNLLLREGIRYAQWKGKITASTNGNWTLTK